MTKSSPTVKPTFDLDQMYICRTEEGVEWGNEVFERFRSRAERVEGQEDILSEN